MVWIILAFLGVPLWLCVLGIGMMVLRNRSLRAWHGDIPVRVQRPGKTRWTRGHAIWVSDVFAWRGSPAAWNDELVHMSDVTLRSPTDAEQQKLRRLGDRVQIAALHSTDGDDWQVAAGSDHRTALVGPFIAEAAADEAPAAAEG